MDDPISLRIFQCPESLEYAKYVRAQINVSFTLQCLLKLKALLKKEPSDILICEALWDAAIVRLFSIFNGKNSINKGIIDELPEGASEVYTFFENYRNKYIAHKVNPFDQIKAGIFLSDPKVKNMEVVGVGSLAMAEVSFTDEKFLNSFGQFVEALEKKIKVNTSEWDDKTLEAAKKRPIEELYKLPQLRVVVPSGSR